MLFAKALDHCFNSGEGRRKFTPSESVADDLGPKAGQGFVVAAIFGVLAAYGCVIDRNALLHAA